MALEVKPLLNEELALTNNLYSNQKQPAMVGVGPHYFLTDIVHIEGPPQVMMGGLARKMLRLALTDRVQLVPFQCSTPIASISITLSTRGHATLSEATAVELIKTNLVNQIPTIGHVYALQHEGLILTATVLQTSNLGLLKPDTLITFDQLDAHVRLTEQTQPTSIFKRNVDIKNIGIGGLDTEFLTLFRKVFASRRLSPKIQKELGISHVRGLLLYGPPGTGKTLLARELGKLLDCVEPIIVNGPSLLNKYVGQSEENVRQLFAPAMADQKSGKDRLHLIICDEFDAIGKKRGSDTGSTGVADNVVNSFLPMIDGIHALNNILVIGITNRIDLIDEALLRSGRFEVKLEIKLPSRDGRLEILNIHTKNMQLSGRLHASVHLEELADMTQNYSGAELAGLIRAATSFAVARELSLDMTKTEPTVNPVVTMIDMVKAVAETVPALGCGNLLYSTICSRVERTKLVDYSLISPEEGLVYSVLLVGLPRGGKTYSSCFMAKTLNYSQVQMVSTMASAYGRQEIQEAVSKCKLTGSSCLILDDLEGLIQWCDVGCVYTNALYQCIRNACKTFIAQNQKMVIIANTSNTTMVQMLGLDRIFTTIMHV